MRFSEAPWEQTLRLIQWVIVLAAAWYGYQWWQDYRSAEATKALATASGFVPAAMPSGARRNVVQILAPLNCPSEAAQRADALAAALTRMGVPNERTSNFSLNIDDPTAEQRAAVDRAVAVLNGEIPAVFVNGMGKANPSADEVLAEYQRTR